MSKIRQKDILEQINDYIDDYLTDCKTYKENGELADAQERAHQIYRLSKRDTDEFYNWMDMLELNSEILVGYNEPIEELEWTSPFYVKIANLAKKRFPEFVAIVGKPKTWKEFEEEYG